jgi:hypothetical protein
MGISGSSLVFAHPPIQEVFNLPGGNRLLSHIRLSKKSATFWAGARAFPVKSGSREML